MKCRLFFLSSSLILFASVNGASNLFDGYKKRDGLYDDIPTITLTNDVELPLVGLGVGNLQTNRVETMIYEAIKSDNRIRLIDTSQIADNEKEVCSGIIAGVNRFKKSSNVEGRLQVHVVTKVWHTHLGYERTKMAVKQSLQNFATAVKEKNIDFKLHILLHHPKCIDDQDEFSCEHQEKNLPSKVRKAGPAPYLDKDNAWKESWKALEDMYTSGDYNGLASIGISNFSVEEVKDLLDIANVKPHLIQVNVRSLIADPLLIQHCQENGIHIQVYNVMTNLLKAPSSPNALHSIMTIANMVSKRSLVEIQVTLPQVALKWLMQLGISSIPRTHDLDHLTENSAMELSKIPVLSDNEKEIVTQAVEAIINGSDLKEQLYTKIIIHAMNKDIFLYVYEQNEDDQRYVSYIGKGDSFKGLTNPDCTYRVYNAYNPEIYKDYTAESISGEHLHIYAKL